jgi:hypothetical protein
MEKPQDTRPIRGVAQACDRPSIKSLIPLRQIRFREQQMVITGQHEEF